MNETKMNKQLLNMIQEKEQLLKMMKDNNIYVSIVQQKDNVYTHTIGLLEGISLVSDIYWVRVDGTIKEYQSSIVPFDITKIEPKNNNETSAKNNHVKENGNMQPIKELKNGVKVYDLYSFVSADFDEAQDILNSGSYTENIDAYCAYNERVKNNFVGVYQVKVERKGDYERFIDNLKNEKHHLDKEYGDKLHDLWLSWIRNEMSSHEYATQRNLLTDEWNKKKKSCNCSLCSFRIPSFEEWKNGKYKIDDKREMKLGKALRKAGFSQYLLDFYSQQIKTEKDVYFTVSDLPQHIAGMSYYAEIGSWDGYSGTSCQDPRHNGSESIHLAGSLHDNKLFIGMLHDSLDDLKDMRNKLLARTMMRLIHIDKTPVLIATTYYGNNETKDILHYAIEQLKEVNIFSNDFLGGYDSEYVVEKANGYYVMPVFDTVHVYERVRTTEYVTCPMCDETGEIEVYSNRLGIEGRTTCPACGGDGTIDVEVDRIVDEWVEVEGEKEIDPYNEGYSHYGNHIEIRVQKELIRDIIEMNKEKVITN